jgi:hypothetical protein
MCQTQVERAPVLAEVVEMEVEVAVGRVGTAAAAAAAAEGAIL